MAEVRANAPMTNEQSPSYFILRVWSHNTRIPRYLYKHYKVISFKLIGIESIEGLILRYVFTRNKVTSCTSAVLCITPTFVACSQDVFSLGKYDT